MAKGHPRRLKAVSWNSVGSGDRTRRKSSGTGRGAPGYRLSPDHFYTAKRMLAPDWAQKMLCIIVPNRRTASPEFFLCVRTRRLSSRHSYGSLTKVVRARETFIFHFPNQKRSNYWWLEKTFRMLLAGPFRFAKAFAWPDESRYSGVLPPVLEHFRRTISTDPTHCPWICEDGKRVVKGVEAVFSKIKYILISKEHALKNVRSKDSIRGL